MSLREVGAKLIAANERKLQLYSRHNFLRLLNGAILSELAGSEQRMRPMFVKNPLSSATLLGSFIRNKVIRKREDAPTMRKRIFRLLSPRNRIWNAMEPIVTKRRLLEETITALERRVEYLSLGNPVAGREATETLAKLKNIRDILSKHSDEYQAVSLFPGIMPRLDDPSIPWSSAYQTSSQLQGNSSSIRGISIRIAGPKRDQRADAQKKSVGVPSIKSIGLVASEHSQAQMPSKAGTYGLDVRISYCLQRRLASISTKVPAFAVPAYKRDRNVVGEPLDRATVFGFNSCMTRRDKDLLDEEDRLCALLSSK